MPYILNPDGTYYLEENFEIFMEWRYGFDNAIKKSRYENLEIFVSTVFIPESFPFFGQNPPLVFETMVFFGFGDGQYDYQSKYGSKVEAEKGHDQIISEIDQMMLMPFKDLPLHVNSQDFMTKYIAKKRLEGLSKSSDPVNSP